MLASTRFTAPVLLAISFAPLAPASASAACGFFETLFGQCRQAPPPPRAPAAPAEAPRKRPVVHSAEDLKQKTLPPPPGARVGSLAHFAEDHTLRRGDVVVTPEGFRVFIGRSDEHTAQDFAPLGSRQGELTDLERVSRERGVGWTAAPALSAAPVAVDAAKKTN